MRSTTGVSALRWRQVFSGEECSLRALRHWLASLLPTCPSRDDVISVATELGGNALQHTASGDGGFFAAEISWHQSAVRVAVADHGGPATPRVVEDPDGENGRGLLLVETFSTRWGWYFPPTFGGKVVWALLGGNPR